jgi:hypothetical protein
MFDRPWSPSDWDTIREMKVLRKSKKVIFTPAVLDKEVRKVSGYDLKNSSSSPANLNQKIDCDFDPCEALVKFSKDFDPDIVFIVAPDGIFSCNDSYWNKYKVYSVNGYEDLVSELKNRVKKRKSRKLYKKILVYVDDNFKSKIPEVAVNGGTINEGESFNLVAETTRSEENGTYIWKGFQSNSKSLSVSPEISKSYEVSYSIDGCTSPVATAEVIVIPKPICEPAEPFSLANVEGDDNWVEYSELFKEYYFYPDPIRQDYYVIQLDSICGPDFITFYLEDPRNGDRKFIQLEKLPFKNKTNSSILEVKKLYDKFTDRDNVFEIAFRTKEFSMDDNNSGLKKFKTKIQYKLWIEATFIDEEGKEEQVPSGPFDVLFIPCPKY